MSSSPTYLWMPAKLSTFVLPVNEIEMILEKLQRIRSGTQLDQPTGQSLTKQISNWNQVLATYRARTANSKLFSSDDYLLNSAVNTLAQMFTDGTLPAYQVMEHAKSSSFDYIKANEFRIKEKCGDLDQYEGAEALCAEFNSENWNTIYDAISQGACDMPSGFSGTSSTLSFSLLRSICQVGLNPVSDIPGDSASTTTGLGSLLGFLDGSKYLTFGAGSPIQLSYTSTVQSTITLEVANEFEKFNSKSFFTEFEKFDAMFLKISNEKSSPIRKKFSSSLTSDNSHKTTKGVKIFLGDDSTGDYFAIRINEDDLYGTPMFTTLGGQSMCPGETATLARESNVRITEVVPRCGPQQNEDCLHLNSGDRAYFSAKILNMSPTRTYLAYSGCHRSETYYPAFVLLSFHLCLYMCLYVYSLLYFYSRGQSILYSRSCTFVRRNK
jgi:hypothetical protein